MGKRLPSSFRLSDEAFSLVGGLSRDLGLSQTAAVEMLIRERTRNEEAPPNARRATAAPGDGK